MTAGVLGNMLQRPLRGSGKTCVKGRRIESRSAVRPQNAHNQTSSGKANVNRPVGNGVGLTSWAHAQPTVMWGGRRHGIATPTQQPQSSTSCYHGVAGMCRSADRIDERWQYRVALESSLRAIHSSHIETDSRGSDGGNTSRSSRSSPRCAPRCLDLVVGQCRGRRPSQ